jgi:hypothetical protein
LLIAKDLIRDFLNLFIYIKIRLYMKKYLFEISALTLAIAFSAFTALKPTSLRTMQLDTAFLGDADNYDLFNGIIQDPANWTEAAPASCNGTLKFACEFQINDADNFAKQYFHIVAGKSVLNTSFTDAGGATGDNDGVVDINLPSIVTYDGSETVPGSSPVRKYQNIACTALQLNPAQKTAP